MSYALAHHFPRLGENKTSTPPGTKIHTEQKIKEDIEATLISRINAFLKIVTEFDSEMPQPSVIPPIIHLARSEDSCTEYFLADSTS